MMITDLGGGVGLTTCGDCEGTGMFSIPEPPDYPCVRCKAAGKVFIMYWAIKGIEDAKKE